MTITERDMTAKSSRHLPNSSRPPGRLALKWFLTLRWHLLALFLSDLGRAMVMDKYSAFTTDNGYDPSPHGTNALTRLADSMVRARDTHVALRQRLDIVVSELVESALIARSSGTVRIVSGPIGLGRDVRMAWSRLVALRTSPVDWIEVRGVDLDPSDTVLERASALAADELVPLQTYRVDMLSPDALTACLGRDVDVFNCIGLSTWLDADSLLKLITTLRATLTPNGVLLIDNWRPHQGSKYVDLLEMPARYPTDEQFETALAEAGFEIEQKRVTANDVVVVYRARSAGARTDSAMSREHWTGDPYDES